MGKLRQPFKLGDRVEVRIGRNGGLRSWTPAHVIGIGVANIGVAARGSRWEVPFKDVRARRDSAPKTRARGARSAVSKLPPRGPKAARGPLRSEEYKAFVRTKPCMFCGESAPSQASHVGLRGLGQKTDDYRCTPKCRTCHQLWGDCKWNELLSRAGLPWGAAAQYSDARDIARTMVALRQVDLLVEYLGEMERAA